ncbi:uncharacterized protein LOC114828367 [Galendromus occidentalis]|uniref:Uncharacterized protein LOC114828367 n=1 Tax=Galendromus occidentalis TaxID=34638 RepID=A0AAJ7SHB0_9ACAR|nr:uncharacterized protein LOC114828367 [Galendromus occidentalis]
MLKGDRINVAALYVRPKGIEEISDMVEKLINCLQLIPESGLTVSAGDLNARVDSPEILRGCALTPSPKKSGRSWWKPACSEAKKALTSVRTAIPLYPNLEFLLPPLKTSYSRCLRAAKLDHDKRPGMQRLLKAARSPYVCLRHFRPQRTVCPIDVSSLQRHFGNMFASTDTTPQTLPIVNSVWSEVDLEWRKTLDEDFNIAEVHNIICSLPSNKVCGEDEIFNEHLKTATVLTPIWTGLFNKCLAQSAIPNKWSSCIMILIAINKSRKSLVTVQSKAEEIEFEMIFIYSSNLEQTRVPVRELEGVDEDMNFIARIRVEKEVGRISRWRRGSELYMDHVDVISEWIGSLMNVRESSDITLIVEGDAFVAHKIMLASSCEYFRGRCRLIDCPPQKKVEGFSLFLRRVRVPRAVIDSVCRRVCNTVTSEAVTTGSFQKTRKCLLAGLSRSIMAEESKAKLLEGAASKKSGIDHVYDLSKRIGSILSDKDSSDITLVVEGEAIYAHKIILAASCDYFRALLQGGMMESDQEEVELKDVPARGFKAVLKYIYTAQLELKSMDVETILEVLSLADLYGLEKMRTSLCEYLEETMSADNVLLICESIEPLSFKHLHEVCVHFMDQVPQAVLESEAFSTSRARTLSRILSRDSFCAEEIEIFRAVTRWCKQNPDPEDQAEVLGMLRLPLIPTKSLLTEVKSSGVITTDRLIEAIQMRECHSADLPLRGVLTQGQNLATKENGAKRLIIVEDDFEVFASPEANLRYRSGDTLVNDFSTYLPVKEAFTVALSKAFFVDYISFRMRHESSASFGYHVEVSVDLVNWIRVFDQPELVCRSLQRLHFKPRVARFIRLLCHELPGHQIGYLSEFEASYTGRDWNSCKGYYAPSENVATVSLGAAVVQCWSGTDEMIAGESNYRLAGTGWTEHQIGGEPIIVQLSQPYAVNSISMVLPRENSHDFSYFVDVSSDRKEWTRVIDRSQDRCKSLQRLKFATVPVSFIKIWGTASSGSKNFSCSEFKCWAEKDEAIPKETEQSNGQPTEAKKSGRSWWNPACSEAKKALTSVRTAIPLYPNLEFLLPPLKTSYSRCLRAAKLDHDKRQEMQRLLKAARSPYVCLRHFRPQRTVCPIDVSSLQRHFGNMFASTDTTPQTLPIVSSVWSEEDLEWRKILDEDFNIAEVHNIICSLPSNKACGEDEIFNEHLRTATVLTPIWTGLFNKCLAQSAIPNKWSSCIMILIAKS